MWRSYTVFRLGILVTLLLAAGVLQAGGVPAFPGAEGHGSATCHGRGGQVLLVTNLNDSGSGSLRAAINSAGPRIIVFQVGGMIRLRSPLNISEPFCMIAGQSAPGAGICLSQCPLKISTHDVVLRFLRSRPGDDPAGYNPENRDALEIAAESPPPYNIVVDHCSFSWAIDENISTWYACRDISIQWCVSSESLRDSLHPEGHHGMGCLIGDQAHHISIHHNLFALNNERNPLLKAGTTTELVNNVIYGWGKAAVHLSNYEKTNRPIISDMVGNYFKAAAGSGEFALYVPENIPSTSSIHWHDNKLAARGTKAANRNVEFLRVSPRPNRGISTTSASAAYRLVLQGAGASLPVRDSVDRRIVNDVLKSKGRIIDRVADTPGYPTYNSASPSRDSDRDGMPDNWETKHGLNPRDRADATVDPTGNGYTSIEEYLNSLVPPSLYGVRSFR